MDAEDHADHLGEAERVRVSIYRSMSPADRLRQALRMSHGMRELMEAALRTQRPELSPHERRALIAERILYARTG